MMSVNRIFKSTLTLGSSQPNYKQLIMPLSILDTIIHAGHPIKSWNLICLRQLHAFTKNRHYLLNHKKTVHYSTQHSTDLSFNNIIPTMLNVSTSISKKPLLLNSLNFSSMPKRSFSVSTWMNQEQQRPPKGFGGFFGEKDKRDQKDENNAPPSTSADTGSNATNQNTQRDNKSIKEENQHDPNDQETSTTNPSRFSSHRHQNRLQQQRKRNEEEEEEEFDDKFSRRRNRKNEKGEEIR